MERDSGIPSGEEARHDAKERAQRKTDYLEELVTQGARGITVLNSGGIVAMLGFVQALAGKQLLTAFKPFAVWGSAFFLAGAVIGAATFAVRYQEGIHRYAGSSYDEDWACAVKLALILSLSAFVAGAVIIGFGVANHL